MASTAIDIESATPQFDDAALMAALRGERADIDPLQALKQLTRRGSARLVEAAAQVLEGRQARPRLQLTAVQALRGLPPAQSQPVLLTALRAADASVRTDAALALGTLGDEKALAALKATDPGDLPRLRDALGLARTLISHRLRLGQHLVALPAAKRRLVLRGAEAQPIGVDLSPLDGQERFAQMQRAVPAMRLSPRGSARLRCAGNDLQLVFVEPFDRPEGLASLFDKAALPLLIFGDGRSVEEPFLVETLLSRPAKDGASVDLVGIRPQGLETHVGSLRRQGDGVDFQFAALATVQTAALELEGHYDPKAGTMRFTQARSHLRVDRKLSPQRRPTPARKP